MSATRFHTWSLALLFLSSFAHAQDIRKPLILGNLESIFYRGNPMPPRPGETELAEAVLRVALAKPEERELLTKPTVFGVDAELWALALRDSDGDGVHDFFIDEEHGRIWEGDTDVDGDGIPNVFDLSPYDADAGQVPPDRDEDGIPDHLDWAHSGRAPRMAAIQKELFRRFNLLLVERSEEFSFELAETVYDTVTLAFRGRFSEGAGFATLRIVATEDFDGISAELSSGTFGYAGPWNKTLTIFRKGLKLPRFLQLGLVGHEITHFAQYELDYDPKEKDCSGSQLVHRRFLRYMKRFGWKAKPYEIDCSQVFTLFTPAHKEYVPSEYRYRGKSPETWQKWLESLGPDYLDDPEVRKLGIVGVYSLNDPWEWHADHFIAYLFNGMEAAASAEQREWAKRANIESWNFYHGNADPKVMERFARTFPIESEDWMLLTHKYLVLEHQAELK